MSRPPRQRPVAALEFHALRRVLQALPQAALIVRHHRVSYANAAACRLLGAQGPGIVGSALAQWFHPDALPGHRERLAALARGGTMLPPLDQRILRQDGTTRSVQTVASVVVDHGRLVELICLHDVTELRWAQDELVRSQGLLRRLAAEREARQEEARRQVGRVLHDELLQPLAAMRMELGSAGGAAAQGQAGAPAVMARASDLAQGAIGATRRVIDDLRPLMLEELGLAPALETLVERFGDRAGLASSYAASVPELPKAAVSPAVALCLYRVAQECLANVQQHAWARRVDVRLAQHGQRLWLRIRDDGVGLHEADLLRPAAFGVLSMRERLRALGGTLTIDSPPGRGTLVEAMVPAVVRAVADLPAPAPAAQAGPHDDAYGNLLAFLYRAPVGLVQARLDGQVEMLNPMAAQMLLPLALPGDVGNLFDVLARAVPELRAMVQRDAAPCGVVCESLPFDVPAGPGRTPRALALSVLRHDDERLMAVIAETPAAALRQACGAAAAAVRQAPPARDTHGRD